MTWFKVDDSFHAHPKVLATEPAALGLWVIAGAWSSAHLTDGVVPDHALSRLLPDSATLAQKLVTAGLWRRIKGGYRFHDWSDFQPSSNDVKEQRQKRAEAGRLGGLASGKARSKPASKTEANAEALASPIVEPPTRPDPKKNKTSSSPPTAATETDPDFDRFWSHYPRKVGKVPARKAWAKAVKSGADPETIIAGSERYARERKGEDDKYTAHAATWIHGQRWDDTPYAAQRLTSGQPSPFWEN